MGSVFGPVMMTCPTILTAGESSGMVSGCLLGLMMSAPWVSSGGVVAAVAQAVLERLDDMAMEEAVVWLVHAVPSSLPATSGGGVVPVWS